MRSGQSVVDPRSVVDGEILSDNSRYWTDNGPFVLVRVSCYFLWHIRVNISSSINIGGRGDDGVVMKQGTSQQGHQQNSRSTHLHQQQRIISVVGGYWFIWQGGRNDGNEMRAVVGEMLLVLFLATLTGKWDWKAFEANWLITTLLRLEPITSDKRSELNPLLSD